MEIIFQRLSFDNLQPHSFNAPTMSEKKPANLDAEIPHAVHEGSGETWSGIDAHASPLSFAGLH